MRAAATAGGLCFFHANPDKAVELGRFGGRSKIRTLPESLETFPNMDDVRGVRRMAQQLIRDLCSGKVHPRVGVGIAPLLNLLPRANQVKDDRAEVRFAEIIRKARERAGLPHTDDTDDDSDSALESEGKP